MLLDNIKKKLSQKTSQEGPDSRYTRKTISVGPDGKRIVTVEPISYEEWLEDLEEEYNDSGEGEDCGDW